MRDNYSTIAGCMYMVLEGCSQYARFPQPLLQQGLGGVIDKSAFLPTLLVNKTQNILYLPQLLF